MVQSTVAQRQFCRYSPSSRPTSHLKCGQVQVRGIQILWPIGGLKPGFQPTQPCTTLTTQLRDLRNLQTLKCVHNFVHHYDKLPCIFLSLHFTKKHCFTATIHISKIVSTAEFSEAYWDKDLLNKKAAYIYILWNSCLKNWKTLCTETFIDKLKEFLINKCHNYGLRARLLQIVAGVHFLY